MTELLASLWNLVISPSGAVLALAVGMLWLMAVMEYRRLGRRE